MHHFRGKTRLLYLMLYIRMLDRYGYIDIDVDVDVDIYRYIDIDIDIDLDIDIDIRGVPVFSVITLANSRACKTNRSVSYNMFL